MSYHRGVPTVWMKDVIDAIENRGSLTVGDERFDPNLTFQKKPFIHIHPQTPAGSYKCADWVAERIAWLVLHRRQQTEVGLAELLSIQIDGAVGYRDSPATHAAKAPRLIQQLRTNEATLFERAAISLAGTNWGRLLVDGLWVGGTYGRHGPESIESWKRVRRRIKFERHHRFAVEPSARNKTEAYSREDAEKRLQRWCGVRDGLALDVASGLGVNPLSLALTALAVPSVRWYLQKGSRWHRRLLWRSLGR